MTTLLIIRHGKADPDSPTGRDEDRPLKPRGIRQSAFLASRINAAGLVPSVILHSPAVRTTQTAHELIRSVAGPARAEASLALGRSARGVLDAIARELAVDRPTRCLVLVGHNPQLEELSEVLCPSLRGKHLSLRTGECLVTTVRHAAHTPAAAPDSTSPPNATTAAGAAHATRVIHAELVDRWRLEEDED